MLEEEGFIKTAQRKRPVVSSKGNANHKTTMLAFEKIDKEFPDPSGSDSLGLSELRPLHDDMSGMYGMEDGACGFSP